MTALEHAAATDGQHLPVGEAPAPIDTPRVEALLRSASLLLARHDFGGAVQALHAELRRELRQSSEVWASLNPSRSELEEQHRQLATEISRRRAQRLVSSRDEVPQRLSLWVAWATVVAVVGGLIFRYAYAVFDRWRWSHQYPDGPWISRYYETSDFQQLQVARYDIAIDYDWGKGSPAEAMDRDYWSATWDVCLAVAAPVELDLRLYADDDGKVVVDDALKIRVSRSGMKSAKVTFSEGVHHVRVEYVERRRGARIKLQGLDFAGTDRYGFQRPRLTGATLSCVPSTP